MHIKDILFSIVFMFFFTIIATIIDHIFIRDRTYIHKHNTKNSHNDKKQSGESRRVTPHRTVRKLTGTQNRTFR